MPVLPNTPPRQQSSDGFVTLTCPHCASQLRTATDTSVEGPCPQCGTTIRYEAPAAPAPPATFVPRKPRSTSSGVPEFEKPRRDEQPHSRTPLAKRTRFWIQRMDDFFYSQTGRVISCAALAALLFYGVVLFFKWDKKRRIQAADSAPPPAEAPADPASADGADGGPGDVATP